MAPAWVAAGLSLLGLPEFSAVRYAGILGQVQRPHGVFVEVVRRAGEREESVELLLRKLGWRRAVGHESGPARKAVSLVSGRQPRSGRRRCAGVVVRATRARV